ncbi:MAG: hypothetical protein GF418_17110 [Chitinivibrionales bacterium]|nr:hypothetical protein [Chitinivibrionales bacterium]MBD3397339.1 hypothetical protein [Chitinivibrionales bacterium]
MWNFVKPSEPGPLLDAIPEKTFDEHRFLPYWAELWPATEILFDAVAKRAFPRTARICDLGAGLGTTASLLASRGLYTVAFDFGEYACRFCRHNILLHNGIPRVVCGDWHHPPFSKPFDVIAGGDILYEPQCLEPVVAFVRACAAPCADVLIADPCRPQWETFKREMTGNGFSIQSIRSRELNNGKTTVEILHARRVNDPTRQSGALRSDDGRA